MDGEKLISYIIILIGFIYLFYRWGVIGDPMIPGLIPISMIAYIIFSIFYFTKNDSRYLYGLLILIIINIVLINIPLPECGRLNPSNGRVCDCIGLRRYEGMGSDCLGLRTNCYKYDLTAERDAGATLGDIIDMIPESKIKIECE